MYHQNHTVSGGTAIPAFTCEQLDVALIEVHMRGSIYNGMATRGETIIDSGV